MTTKHEEVDEEEWGTRVARCYYCGDYGPTIDHNQSSTWTGSGKRSRSAYVSCCQSCNSMLSDKRITDFDERRAYIHRRLRERYSRVLEDGYVLRLREILDGLEGQLRRRQVTRICEAEHILARLDWSAPFGRRTPKNWWEGM